jgi:hypothetical protein
MRWDRTAFVESTCKTQQRHSVGDLTSHHMAQGAAGALLEKT